MSARDAILSRIQNTHKTSLPYDALPRNYRVTGPADLRLLEERLSDYGVRVHLCSPDQIPSAIQSALSAAGKHRILIPLGFPQDALPNTIDFVRDHGQSYEQLDRAEGVLTTCAAAIAETGTLLLRHSDAEGRRALTLIPDYHLCLVRANQVVATVPEGIRVAAQFGNAPVTTISGPSATSDIEMTRVKGVHGPRTLEVILVLD